MISQHPDNPPENILPKSTTDEALVDGIKKSGYPLQGRVSSELKKNFGVTEEWGYIDRKNDQQRSLDVFAYLPYSEYETEVVQPRVALLIECKSSVHPYVFFKNVVERPMPSFPSVAGLRSNKVAIHDRTGSRYVEVPGTRAFGLDRHPFVKEAVATCAAFSQARLSGKKAELSGSDPYNNIVKPLIHAHDYAYELYKAKRNSSSIYPTLLLCLSVLDAPMLLVTSPDEVETPQLTPWIRIVRNEASTDFDRSFPTSFYGVDTVHIGYFQDFINDQLLPFAGEFARRVHQLSDVLQNGGYVTTVDDWEWDQISANVG